MMSRRSARLVLPHMASVRRSRSMHDSALEALGMGIIEGFYPIGSLLPSKEELMERLDVSHTTLREALQTLSAKGMVAARAKVGTRVLAESHWNMFDADILAWRLEKGIEPAFLATLFEIRQTLEPTAAALMARRGSDADITQLRKLAKQLVQAPNEKTAFVSADIAFHQLILEASGNPFMQSLGALINTTLTASFMLSAPTAEPELSEKVRQQHLRVAEAVANRDPQGASDAMLAVIHQGWNAYHPVQAVPIATLRVGSFVEDER